MTKRVLVTGSEGFVGRHLRRALVERGALVLGVDLASRGAEFEHNLGDSEFSADELAERVGPVDGIVHLAARITRGSSVDGDARRNLRAIAEVPVRLMEAFSARHGSTHLVFCSSIKVYGDQGALPIVPELSPLRPEAHSYGSAKALAERLLEISRARGLGSYAIVRPSFIYGPGQPATTAIPAFLRGCWQGTAPTVFGDGLQLRDDVLASDVAHCLAEACLRRAEGAFNAAGERSRTLFEVAELCCRAVEAEGGPRGLLPTLSSARPPARWINQSFDISRTRALLDYEPVAMLTGLAREARWLNEGADPVRASEYAAPAQPRGAS
jgi:nucleoside-diphosphate-sugar epimerase